MRVMINRIEKDGKITLQESGGIAIVTLHRPNKKNALTKKMWKELANIGRKIPQNPKNKLLILRGAGGLFTAGSDIKEFSKMGVEEANESFRLMEEAISTFEKIPLPTIATIKGPAMGAGFVLALSCDLRIGTQGTKMGIPIGRLGITLSKHFIKRIVNLVGPSRMKDLVYTGRILDKDESYDWGLVNYCVPETESSDHYSIELAKTILEQSPASLRAVKEGVAYSAPFFEIPLVSDFKDSVDPHDFPEGVRAFIEKRKPNFKE
jgi:enoyl-CoA hydratase